MNMDVQKMIEELRAEQRLIDAAIDTLTRMGLPKRRGRPPAWLATVAPVAGGTPKRGKRGMSAEGRKRVGDAARKRWAAFRQAKAAEKSESAG